jgi:deoxyribodipyrimidine photo-lyase
MQAGITGINAIRVYSPTKQFLDHDPEGTFVKKWVPELRQYTPAEIAYAEEVRLAAYTPPVICIKERSKQMKERVYAIRRSVKGKKISQEVLQKHGSRKGTGRVKRKKSTGLSTGQLALFKDSSP